MEVLSSLNFSSLLEIELSSLIYFSEFPNIFLGGLFFELFSSRLKGLKQLLGIKYLSMADMFVWI